MDLRLKQVQQCMDTTELDEAYLAHPRIKYLLKKKSELEDLIRIQNTAIAYRPSPPLVSGNIIINNTKYYKYLFIIYIYIIYYYIHIHIYTYINKMMIKLLLLCTSHLKSYRIKSVKICNWRYDHQMIARVFKSVFDLVPVRSWRPIDFRRFTIDLRRVS